MQFNLIILIKNKLNRTEIYFHLLLPYLYFYFLFHRNVEQTVAVINKFQASRINKNRHKYKMPIFFTLS